MIKIFKKASALFLAAAICLPTFAFAQKSFSASDVEFKGGMIYISGTTPKSLMSVTISVVKSTEAKNDINNLFYIEEILSDDNANYEFLFNMKDAQAGSTLTGDYTLYVKCSGENALTKNFTYYDYTAVLNQLKQAQTDAQIFTVLENDEERNSFVALGFDMDLYGLLSDAQKKDFAKALIEGGSVGSDAQGVAEKFASCLGVALINTKNSNYVIKGLELLNPVCDKTSYKSITDNTYKTFVNECIVLMEDITTSQDVINACKKADALYKINTAAVGAIDELIKNLSDTLGITQSSEYEKWSNLSGNNLTAASKNLVTSLSKNKAKTVAALLGAIDAAGTITSASSGGSGGGGGGSSKSSGGGYTLGGVTTIVPEAERFTDLDLALWAKDAILKLSDKNIISGYGDNTFMPNKLIKREEFVKILVGAFDITDSDEDISFFDVDKNEWYYPYIKAAYSTGIIKGISNDEFGISSYVTRQDMAVMLHRIIKLKGIEAENIRSYNTFADEAAISSYAAESVKYLYTSGLLNGYEDLTFKPTGNTTRAEAAYIINSILTVQ